MTFRSEGFVVFRNGVTDIGLKELHRLSKAREAEAIPTIAGRSWGECQLKYLDDLRAIDIAGSALKRKIEDIGFAKPWQVLASDFAHPHLTYCFQAGARPGLALEQHTDGAPKGADCVAQPELLMGALLEDVPSPECGPYVYWPKSHLHAIDHLERAPESLLVDRVRSIPPSGGTPSSFLGCAGDVIVAHRLLRHGTASRSSSGVRRMAFFRLGNEFLPVGARVGDTSFARL
jgi:hypothetical protein